MIPALPCGGYEDEAIPPRAFWVAAFEEGDTPHLLAGQYRIDTTIRALQALQACGHEDLVLGSVPVGGAPTLALIGIDGDISEHGPYPGCIVVAQAVREE